jgi:hypothetical protein
MVATMPPDRPGDGPPGVHEGWHDAIGKHDRTRAHRRGKRAGEPSAGPLTAEAVPPDEDTATRSSTTTTAKATTPARSAASLTGGPDVAGVAR